MKLLEEVEGPYKLKCQLLAQEAETAQQNFVRLRREHEELQANYRNLVRLCTERTTSHICTFQGTHEPNAWGHERGPKTHGCYT